MTKTSSPRTFSLISTKISISEKRRMLAWVSGRFRQAEMASASGRLLLPVRIFIGVNPSSTSGRGRTEQPCPQSSQRRAEYIQASRFCKPRAAGGPMPGAQGWLLSVRPLIRQD